MVNIVSLLSGKLGSRDVKEPFISVLYELRKWFDFVTAKHNPAVSRGDGAGTKATL